MILSITTFPITIFSIVIFPIADLTTTLLPSSRRYGPSEFERGAGCASSRLLLVLLVSLVIHLEGPLTVVFHPRAAGGSCCFSGTREGVADLVCTGG